MEKKKRKKLDLSGLNVEALMIGTKKAAVEFGLLEASDLKPETIKRVFRKEATWVSR